MKRKILITGAGGNVGTETLHSLKALNHDFEIIAGLRNPEINKKKFNDESLSYRFFDFEKPETFMDSLQDISILFLLRPPQLADVKKYFKPLIDAAKILNLQHIVFLSVQGADKNSFIPHHKIEQLILASGIPFTFMRPAYFMQNFLTTLKKDLVDNKEIFLPAGKAKFTLVDLQDVGEVCARILTESENHLNQSYELTNRELVSFGEMTAQLSEELGKRISYTSPSLLSFFIRKKREDMPSVFILVMIMLHYFPRFQKAPQTSDAIQSITGKAPITFREFINRNILEFEIV